MRPKKGKRRAQALVIRRRRVAECQDASGSTWPTGGTAGAPRTEKIVFKRTRLALVRTAAAAGTNAARTEALPAVSAFSHGLSIAATITKDGDRRPDEGTNELGKVRAQRRSVPLGRAGACGRPGTMEAAATVSLVPAGQDTASPTAQPGGATAKASLNRVLPLSCGQREGGGFEATEAK